MPSAEALAFGKTMECLARNEVLGDLSFELDAMGAVLGHGFHPLKARQFRSIPNPQIVHRQGRAPTPHFRMTGVPSAPHTAEHGDAYIHYCWSSSDRCRHACRKSLAVAGGGYLHRPASQPLDWRRGDMLF
jgi:hypothetical protein